MIDVSKPDLDRVCRFVGFEVFRRYNPWNHLRKMTDEKGRGGEREGEGEGEGEREDGKVPDHLWAMCTSIKLPRSLRLDEHNALVVQLLLADKQSPFFSRCYDKNLGEPVRQYGVATKSNRFSVAESCDLIEHIALSLYAITITWL